MGRTRNKIIPPVAPDHPYLSPYEPLIESFLNENRFFRLVLESLHLNGVTGDLSQDNLSPGDRYGILSPMRLAGDSKNAPNSNHGRVKFLAYEQDLAMLMGCKSYEEALILVARTGLALDHIIPSLQEKLSGNGIVWEVAIEAPVDPYVSQEIVEPHYWRVTIGTTFIIRIKINTTIQGGHVLTYGNI